MPQQQAVTKQWPATCYYVQDENWFAYFTVTEEIGLLQAYTDFGIYSYRWATPGQPFKDFLIGSNNTAYKFGLNARCHSHITSQKAQAELDADLGRLMQYLWPLFIEQLKAEREPEKAVV